LDNFCVLIKVQCW